MKFSHALAGLALGLALGMPMATPVMAASVKVTVDDATITDVQIAARAKLFELERKGSSNAERLTMAQNELIEEAIKLNEAKRLNITVSDSQVSDAFLSVARNLRVSSDNLNTILNQNGVNPQTLRDRLRVAIAWSQVSRNVISARVQLSDIELEQTAATKLTASDSYDYILKEVLFIGKGNRSSEANRYRSAFNSCDNAVQLSLNYTDAAVIDMGRRHATQLPDAVASELASLNVGGITKPRVVENGVSMLAVCAKNEARDLTFVKNEVAQEVGNERLQVEAENYLKELREKSRISRR